VQRTKKRRQKLNRRIEAITEFLKKQSAETSAKTESQKPKSKKEKKMKAIILLAIFGLAAALSDPAPCCAPMQWSGSARNFMHDGTLISEYIVLDSKNQRAFVVTTQSEETTFYTWIFETQGIMYNYNVQTQNCMQSNFTGPLNNFCVGTANQTYETNITLGSAMGNVYTTVDENGNNVDIVADSVLCVPIAVDAKPPVHPGKDKFVMVSIFYNIVDNVDNFQPLPTQCSSQATVSEKRSVEVYSLKSLKTWYV